MKVFPHLSNDDTAYVSVFLSAAQYASLHKYMHMEPGQLVSFPHGVKLFKRGFGWYRLDTSNNHRAGEKLRLAVCIIRRWYREQLEAQHTERRVEVQVQRMTQASGSRHRLIRATRTSSKRCPLPPQPASTAQLSALAARFARH
ncbi:hypothetical protein [Ralstonia phage phiRSL1]|uniref:Uncharacterized protein n=1 Tax=Ralstonia phage phiRSL1 TaxID=1980924 RepID=B2ZYG5_9CAUD|nr:hypothetical protein RSL1_ORF317 [Ralstonia phage phiRSL1]BAG41764.1 hypothetical protein [Ralstonia phage phiRSL1]